MLKWRSVNLIVLLFTSSVWIQALLVLYSSCVLIIQTPVGTNVLHILPTFHFGNFYLFFVPVIIYVSFVCAAQPLSPTWLLLESVWFAPILLEAYVYDYNWFLVANSFVLLPSNVGTINIYEACIGIITPLRSVLVSVVRCTEVDVAVLYEAITLFTLTCLLFGVRESLLRQRGHPQL